MQSAIPQMLVARLGDRLDGRSERCVSHDEKIPAVLDYRGKGYGGWFFRAETQSESRMTRFRSGTPYLVKSVSFEFATCPPLP